ncbi:hypothetical protein VTN02DRAFT_4343 [Thermoascus thermophilus]
MAAKFASPPRGATLTKVTPFTVTVTEEAVQELRAAIAHCRLPPVTYEGIQQDRKYGITRDWLEQAAVVWRNKRACEKHMNTFPQFKALIIDDDGKEYSIHFAALFSKKADAVPVMLLHGWPGSFLEFLPVMDRLRNSHTPESLPYHVVVPSLPGYGFSSQPPLDCDFRLEDVARILNRLMVSLGLGTGYVAQGGDIGSKIARILAVEHANCKAVHINFCIIPQPETPIGTLSEPERIGLERTAAFKRMNSSYALQHATKPSTIGLVLSSSPLALLAWVAEKFLDWTDEDLPLEIILESATLYWVTNTISTSLYPYRQLFTPGVVAVHENPKWYITKPFGYSWFPKELAPIPRSWAATTGKLIFYRQHDSGGHFAALEKPDVFLKDLEDFISEVWKP